jgi:hypothetical protein
MEEELALGEKYSQGHDVDIKLSLVWMFCNTQMKPSQIQNNHHFFLLSLPIPHVLVIAPYKIANNLYQNA